MLFLCCFMFSHMMILTICPCSKNLSGEGKNSIPTLSDLCMRTLIGSPFLIEEIYASKLFCSLKHMLITSSSLKNARLRQLIGTYTSFKDNMARNRSLDRNGSVGQRNRSCDRNRSPDRNGSVGRKCARNENGFKKHDLNCQRLRAYNSGLCAALRLLDKDLKSAMYDVSLSAATKEFCLCTTCACNGPATPTPGDYCLVKACCCCNPCCWCPPKCIYIPPVADGPHPVRTEFFYLRQIPTGENDAKGQPNYEYFQDAGFTLLCRPRNARGQWTRTCHSTC